MTLSCWTWRATSSSGAGSAARPRRRGVWPRARWGTGLLGESVLGPIERQFVSSCTHIKGLHVVSLCGCG